MTGVSSTAMTPECQTPGSMTEPWPAGTRTASNGCSVSPGSQPPREDGDDEVRIRGDGELRTLRMYLDDAERQLRGPLLGEAIDLRFGTQEVHMPCQPDFLGALGW